jgi:hypothetical protein
MEAMTSRSEKRPLSAKSKSRIGRGVEKHNYRLGINEATGRANDPNYARKWKKIKSTGRWLRAAKAASKTSRVPGHRKPSGFAGAKWGGNKGPKLSGFAAAKWGHKTNKPWWTKV